MCGKAINSSLVQNTALTYMARAVHVFRDRNCSLPIPAIANTLLQQSKMH